MIARPLVWLLENITAFLLKLLRIPEQRADNVTEEEVRIAIAEGTEAGVIDEVEQKMIHGVLALADSSVASVMVPRPDVYWIDLDDDQDDRAGNRRLPLFAHRGRCAAAISAGRSAWCRRRISSPT